MNQKWGTLRHFILGSFWKQSRALTSLNPFKNRTFVEYSYFMAPTGPKCITLPCHQTCRYRDYQNEPNWSFGGKMDQWDSLFPISCKNEPKMNQKWTSRDWRNHFRSLNASSQNCIFFCFKWHQNDICVSMALQRPHGLIRTHWAATSLVPEGPSLTVNPLSHLAQVDFRPRNCQGCPLSSQPRRWTKILAHCLN